MGSAWANDTSYVKQWHIRLNRHSIDTLQYHYKHKWHERYYYFIRTSISRSDSTLKPATQNCVLMLVQIRSRMLFILKETYLHKYDIQLLNMSCYLLSKLKMRVQALLLSHKSWFNTTTWISLIPTSIRSMSREDAFVFNNLDPYWSVFKVLQSSEQTLWIATT